MPVVPCPLTGAMLNEFRTRSRAEVAGARPVMESISMNRSGRFGLAPSAAKFRSMMPSLFTSMPFVSQRSSNPSPSVSTFEALAGIA